MDNEEKTSRHYLVCHVGKSPLFSVQELIKVKIYKIVDPELHRYGVSCLVDLEGWLGYSPGTQKEAKEKDIIPPSSLQELSEAP